jgi:hypothetical protein
MPDSFPQALEFSPFCHAFYISNAYIAGSSMEDFERFRITFDICYPVICYPQTADLRFKMVRPGPNAFV